MLPEVEWAFHLVPGDQLKYCALWEIERHCGGNLQPWLALTEDQRRRNILSVKGDSFREVLPSAPVELGDLFTEKEVVRFLIDLHEKRNVLVRQFERWLDSRRTNTERHKPRPPACHWKSFLADLVIYRATAAGLQRKPAQDATAPLWKAWKLDNATSGILSAPHWSRALKRAKNRLENSKLSSELPF